MTYDDSRLFKLFGELDPKRRKQALKGAMSRTGSKVRRVALKNLRSAFKAGKDLEKQLRKVNYRKQLGFRLTVRPNGKSKRAPILMWGETGTRKRYTKTETKIYRRKKRSHYTGQMPRYGFMERTRSEVDGEVTEMFRQEVVRNVTRIARKYGCTVT